jgi:hypothetical protein
MPTRVSTVPVDTLTRRKAAARVPAVALVVLLAGCSLPTEQLSLPQPIGGAQATGSIGRPGGTPLGPPSTPGAGQPQIYPGSANYLRPGDTAEPSAADANAAPAPVAGAAKAPSANGGRSVGVETADGVSLDLAGATIPEAAATILNDLMRVPYTVSDRVKGTVTLQTREPKCASGIV